MEWIIIILIGALGFNQDKENNTEITEIEINSVDLVNEFKEEVYSITDTESFLHFLINHSPTYEDLDTLYTYIYNETCPENLTYELVHGDSSKIIEIPMDYAYIVARNTKADYCILDSTTSSWLDVPFLIQNENLKKAFKTMLPKIKNKIIWNTNQLMIDGKEFTFSKNDTIELDLISTSKNLKSQGYQNVLKKMRENRDSLLNDQFIKTNSKIRNEDQNMIFLKISDSLQFNDGSLSDKYYRHLTEELGGGQIAENITDWIQSQLFHDGFFVYINNRFIFIDLEP